MLRLREIFACKPMYIKCGFYIMADLNYVFYHMSTRRVQLTHQIFLRIIDELWLLETSILLAV